MKKIFIFYLHMQLFVFYAASAQTVYVPDSTSGIGSSTNANVGIGIASPDEKLHVSGNLKLKGNAKLIFNAINATDPYGAISFNHLDESRWIIDYGTGQTNDLRFLRISAGQASTLLNFDYDNSQFEIFNANVGIGTNNPQSKLHVAGDMRVTNLGAIGLVSEIRAIGTMSNSTNSITAILRSGTGDGASFSSWNGGLSSWFGIGFHSAFDNTTRGVFNTRNGDFSIKGKISSEGTGHSYFAGSVGIGAPAPDAGFKLTVAGKMDAREVKVTVNAGSDFVFEEHYPLMELEELQAFIKENKHLPEIAPEKEMLENGVEVGKFQIKLLQKVEELTLYIIDQDKLLKEVIQKNEKLEERLKRLEK
ncbi:tail fiber protein [Fulvivirgaceae bacterium BMA12]|uniref:Tail fiber protein n=1 Tax=Agaribacillus aureus TaxID=3051825 RepID=A0ABT8LD41_9BACT|nr:tail fiber protein [Fulvivirgaceae bacterium BMA12]